jgi:hypothetical protein
MPRSYPRQTHEWLDGEIASLREEVEFCADPGTPPEPKLHVIASRPNLRLRARRAVGQGRWFARKYAGQVATYALIAAITILVGWLVASYA